MSNHMVNVNVVLYGLTYLSFFQNIISMCPRPYIFVSEITALPMSFSFPIISYRFHFWWKNVKVKVVEPFADHFRPFSSLRRWPSPCSGKRFNRPRRPPPAHPLAIDVIKEVNMDHARFHERWKMPLHRYINDSKVTYLRFQKGYATIPQYFFPTCNSL
jgi:hypothetical protein